MVNVFNQLHIYCPELNADSIVFKLSVARLLMEKCLDIYIPDT